MSDLIKINTDRLKNDASEIKKHIEGIKSELTNLKRLQKGKAGGEVSVETLEEAVTSLEAMNAYETNAAKEYEECERKVGELVAQIKI